MIRLAFFLTLVYYAGLAYRKESAFQDGTQFFEVAKFKRKYTDPSDTVATSFACMSCTSAEEPVCARNGRLYLNICELECRRRVPTRKQTAVEASCRTIADQEETMESELSFWCYPPITFSCERCSCLVDYDPVCGTDGFMYANKCSMECYGEAFKQAVATTMDDPHLICYHMTHYYPSYFKCLKDNGCTTQPARYTPSQKCGREFQNPCYVRCHEETNFDC